METSCFQPVFAADSSRSWVAARFEVAPLCKSKSFGYILGYCLSNSKKDTQAILRRSYAYGSFPSLTPGAALA
ncbi:hypothetical protein [Desulfitobacterium metallireducens]|uniref:hypothetical protein n=1 Tax=Desulfitobacterium metallireducens TaxID=142877 RepID=UPI00143AFE52|nr:hypothetical protein [Desulfitobacterium metallireducens]